MIQILCIIFDMIGGAFEGVEDQVSPFGYKRGEGIDAGAGEPEWIVNKERYKYNLIFEKLGPCDGKISGAGKSTYNILTLIFEIQLIRINNTFLF